MAALSIAVIATCSAVFTLIYLHSSRLVAVIGVTHEVPQGQTVEATDLRQVEISLGDGVQAIAVVDAAQVIGRPAAVTLLAGTLLSPSDIGGEHALPTGQAVVGVDLKPGMLPAAGVEPGERVLVVLTGPADSPVTTTPVKPAPTPSGESVNSGVIATATVVGIDQNPDGSGTGDVVVSVQVPSAVASLVADSSAAGQAALVQIGGSS
jgi:hypothetical protein